MDSSGAECSNFVPETVMGAVRRTSSHIDEVEANLEHLLSYCDAETLSRLEPLERARVFCSIAKSITALFSLRLRCKGVSLEDHPIKKELERLNLYEEKLQRCVDLSRAPLRPSVRVNPGAAARVIEHSLPDLSQEQRQTMREISRGDGSRSNHLDRKRKHVSVERKSVRAAAQEFLEKATRELLGDDKTGIKGPPLRVEDSDEDDVIVLD